MQNCDRQKMKTDSTFSISYAKHENRWRIQEVESIVIWHKVCMRKEGERNIVGDAREAAWARIS